MSKLYSNVQSGFDTFATWLARTNDLLNDMGTIVITTASNTSGGTTSGNAYVNGFLSANVFSVTEAIRAGTILTPGSTIPMVSNVYITGNGSLLTVGNSTVNAAINSTSFSGKSATASALATPRRISITTDGTGNVSFDGTGNVAIALVLANTTVTPGTYGNTTTYPVFTTDSKGRITEVTSQTYAVTSGVTAFNGRTGAVTLTVGDITGNSTSGLNYTPVSANGSGSISGSLTLTSNGDLTTRDVLASRELRVGNSTVNTVINSTSLGIYSTTGKAIAMAIIFGG